MSSTNRSDSRDSHIADYYVTPTEDIKTFLDAFLAHHEDIDLSTFTILDPCAGGNPYEEWEEEENTVSPMALLNTSDPFPENHIVRVKKIREANPMSYPTVLEQYNPRQLITNDIREDSPAQFHRDFLNHTPSLWFDMVITNPPFNIALDIIKKSLEFTVDGGYVIMLLRLNFFGSKMRKQFFEGNMPIETYVHHKRISFAKGATDSIEYMHCVWRKGQNPDHTKLYLI